VAHRRSFIRHLLSAAACAAALATSAGPAAAQSTLAKIAPDLARVIGTAVMPSDLVWARTLGQGNFVKVLIVASGDDPRLDALRQTILANGGSIYYVYDSVRAMSAMLPVALVPVLAARTDVQMIMPNRPTARTASLLQDASGSSAVPKIGGIPLVDGKGVGIAVLDSGIDWYHCSVLDAAGKSRVAQVVESNAASQRLLTSQVVLLDAAAGANSAVLASGLFTPTATLAGRAAAGSGRVLSDGFILSEGFILNETLADPIGQTDRSLIGAP
jgi:hypothetical protein